MYEPLSDDDLEDLMRQLSSRFPMNDDFGHPEPAEEEETHGAAGIAGLKRVYPPASSDAISKYTDIDYPKWINDCESTLSNLHKVLQSEAGQPVLTVAACNGGTRPGSDALVQISECGNFWICPPPDPENEDETEQPKRTVLDPPPTPPKGQWNLISPQVERFNRLFDARPELLEDSSIQGNQSLTPPRFH